MMLLSVAPICSCVYVLPGWSKVNRLGLGRPNRKSTVKRAQKARKDMQGHSDYAVQHSSLRTASKREENEKKNVRLRKFGSCDAVKPTRINKWLVISGGGFAPSQPLELPNVFVIEANFQGRLVST